MDLGFYIEGSNFKNARKMFETTPTFALTTPVYDRRWRVLRSLSRLRAASRQEFAQKHSWVSYSKNLVALSEVGEFHRV